MRSSHPTLLPSSDKDLGHMTGLRSLHRTVGTATVAVGAAGFLVLSTGTAYAFWTVYGSGTGNADAATAQPVTVSVQVDGQLYPGVKRPVTPTFSNPNPFPVTLTSVTPTDIEITGATGCTKANAAVAFAGLSGSWTVPAKSGGANGTLTPTTATAEGVSMGSTSDTACQGATFTAQYSVAGQNS